ncbi:MAG: cryptochrome/photolyase family protein, partial [Myxococcota bacterium]
MSVFRQALRQLQTTRAAPTRWVYAAYDQLTDRVGPLARHPPSEVGLVLVENAAKARRRPYHQQKLALLLANMRTFALEQAALGRAVRYLHTDEGYAAALRPWAKEFGPMQVMRPAEWELRAELAPLFDEGLLEEVPHEGWLTTRSDFLQGAGAKAPWRMDRFYRHVRKATGLLMEGREPVGGKWSFDVENRLPWAGTPPAPAPPTFAVDDVRAEVVELVSRHFGDHPGRVDEQSLPCTEADIAAMRDFARRQIPHFGPYEDAMSLRSTTIFHTRLSALVNLHRVLPRDVIEDTLSSPAPLQSREGLIRQVLGWREFVHHVHEETDGFRTLRGGKVPTSHQPGDAGYAAWRGTEGESVLQPPGLGGAKPNVLSQSQDLPGAFWGKQSGLHCLDHVVTTVLDEGYSHHITRLMVLANIASLLDVEPRQVSD